MLSERFVLTPEDRGKLSADRRSQKCLSYSKARLSAGLRLSRTGISPWDRRSLYQLSYPGVVPEVCLSLGAARKMAEGDRSRRPLRSHDAGMGECCAVTPESPWA